MTHEHKPTNDRHKLDDSGLERVHMDGGTGPLITEDEDELVAQLLEFAKTGKHKPKDLVRLVDSLSYENKAKLQDLMDDFAKRISGDEVLELGQVLNDRLDFRIKTALNAKQPVSDAALRRYMHGMSASDLKWLGDNEPILKQVRKLLPGPFAVEFPLAAEFPQELHSKPLLVQWYLAKSDPTLVALNFTYKASAELAASLDSIQDWSWLDHLHVAHSFYYGAGLKILRDATTNTAVHDRIVTMLGSLGVRDYTFADTEGGKSDLKNEIDKPTNSDMLLDAAGRSMDVGDQDPAKLAKRLEHEKPNVVLELALATSMPLAQSIPSLASAKGATTEQMVGLMLDKKSDERAAALVDDKLRSSFLKVTGKTLPLARLFPDDEAREAAHAMLYTHKPLREWAYLDKDPTTKLWIAAGSSHAKEACKLVGRELGDNFKWVHDLPTTASATQLRRFAMNCSDEKATKFVREHLLSDREALVDSEDNQAQAVNGEVYNKAGVNGAEARIDSAALTNDVDTTKVLDRIADMDASERAAVLKDEHQLKIMFGALANDSAVRAVYLLAPTIPQLLKLPITNEPGLLDYIASRSGTEQAAALQKPALVKPARALLPAISPLQVYPALDDPKVMATALDATPELLNWLLEDTEPSLAVACLARDGVRDVAAPLFESRGHMWEHLPAYKQLLPAGKQGFDTLAKQATEDESKDEIKDYKHGRANIDAAVEKRGEQMADASAEAHLWGGIDKLAKENGNQKSALALVNNASAKERIALLDGSHTDSVDALKTLTVMSPRHVFQGLSTAQLLALPDGASWLLESEPPYATLEQVAADSKGLAALANVLGADTKRGASWIARLPQGAELTAQERHALDQLCTRVDDEELLRSLFQARFGTFIDATYKGSEVKRVWGVLARLPPAQVNQQVIQSFTHGDLGPHVAGLWNEQSVFMDNDRKKNERDDSSFDEATMLSPDKVKSYYGLDDKGLADAQKGDNAWISQDQGKFRVKEIDYSQFDSTVLHEVGHSVDTMLGEHTDIIYGKGGWKRYGVDQFEEWAKEMGALSDIDGKDRKEVVQAWKDAIRANKPVSEMVDAKHPALDQDKYGKDPLVSSAVKNWTFQYKDDPRPSFNGRVFTTNGVVLSSVPQQTADTAPSEYAMSAPAEYFAECYVEFYRAYDGTPKTEDKKGGHLANWIKSWFAQNVDRARFNPHRLHGDEQTPQPTTQPDKNKVG